jgi:hypothetical protein
VLEQANLQSWHVRGGPGPFQGKDLMLTLSSGSIRLSESSAGRLEIPMERLLSAYDFVPETKNKPLDDWNKGREEACGPSGECSPLLLGIPIWLLSDVILRKPVSETHFVVVRWQEGQSVSELSFQTESSEWKEILKNLQTSLGKSQERSTASEAEWIRRQFEGAKQTDLNVYLESTVQIARWPPLHGPDRYHDSSRA